MRKPMLTLFCGFNGVLATAAGLSPPEAASHAWNFTSAELLLLSDEALLAVARVRPLRCRSTPPAPVMPRPDGRRVSIRH